MPREKSDDRVYAASLGLTGKRANRIIQRLGGTEKLRALSPEARAVLLSPLGNGDSQELSRGGLRARGMMRAKDIRSQ